MIVNGVIGVDIYNQSLTGTSSKTLNSKAADADHVPVVIVKQNDSNDNAKHLPSDNRR